MPISGRVKVSVSDLIDLIERRKADCIAAAEAKNSDFEERFNKWRTEKMARLTAELGELKNLDPNNVDEVAFQKAYGRDYSMPIREVAKTSTHDADIAALRMSKDEFITVGNSNSGYHSYF